MMKPGDWMCPSCGDHQFAKNMACRKCGAANPAGGGVAQAGYGGGMGMGGGGGGGCMGGMGKPGDWLCPSCGDHQFAKNIACRKCGTPKPDLDPSQIEAAMAMGGGGGGGAAMMKPGDWMCPSCGDHQFAKNMTCRKCGAPNPTGGCGGAIMGGGADMSNMKPGDWLCQQCGDLQFAKNTTCRKCGGPHPMGGGGGMMGGGGGMMGMMGGGGASMANMKPGDWLCQQCGDHQYARNPTCRKCGAPAPAGGGAAMAGMGGGCGGMNMMAMMGGNMKPGDWLCQGCGDHQFAKNETCRKCGAPKPTMDGAMAMMGGMQAFATGGGPVPKPGDWNCTACGDLQFARNEACRKCGAPRPAGVGGPGAAMQPGDWMCPQCGDHQFARNSTCRKCGGPKPAELSTGRERSRSPQRMMGMMGQGMGY